MRQYSFVFILILNFNLSLSQHVLNPQGYVDTTIIKSIDVTGDSIPEQISLSLKAVDFYAPFAWTLSIKYKEIVIYSYSEDGSGSEFKFIEDPSCRKEYIKCKYNYYFKDFVGLNVRSEIDFGERALLFSKKYNGSIYSIAKKYLIDSCKLSSETAGQAIEKVIQNLKNSKAVIISHDSGEVETTLPMTFFPEVNCFVPIYNE